uniref:Complex I-B17 n=1 Tax=Gongylonema pulchrum TaxID=637853 RepID=A0A183DW15_9BILA
LMSKPEPEPRVLGAVESKRVSYLKPRSRISVFWDRLLYNVRYTSRHWKDRVYVRFTVGILIYTVGLYAFIIKYYGTEHPLNRYQWRQMKKRGQLSEEMLRYLMSKPEPEPRVLGAVESKRVSYLKPRSRISVFWDRLLYNVRYTSRHWKDRVYVRFTVGILIYTVG